VTRTSFSPHGELHRRAAALHGGFTAVRSHGEAKRAVLALRDAEMESDREEEKIEARCSRFARSRAPASFAMAGEEEDGRFGLPTYQ
jgi:hypothetical protein